LIPELREEMQDNGVPQTFGAVIEIVRVSTASASPVVDDTATEIP
jgi:hypothetical protein